MKQDALSKMDIANNMVSLLILFFACQYYTSLQTIGASASAPSATVSQSNNVTRQLAQAAPYALDNGASQQGESRNIILRLSADDQVKNEEDPWQLGAKNGSTPQAASRLQMNLKKLLEALNNNSFTSEVRFEEQNNGTVNVSILNSRNLTDPIDEVKLRELIIDANSMTWLNGSQVVKDNHRFEIRHPQRMRPINVEINTPPPIRRTMDVVAENYTLRKVADEANMFAVKLINQLNIEKLGSQNLIQSPFAVYQGLALLLTGAMGDTAKELDKVLLGSSSVYENTKLTHDQDRNRLLASFSDTVRQLHFSSTHHLRRSPINNNSEQVDLVPVNEQPQSDTRESGGSLEQHYIVANNLLFAPQAYEVSNEFKNYVSSYYNHTTLSRVETGSTESIQTINSWIRHITGGMIPSIINKKNTFDEYNVLALLCTSWLAQRWRDDFTRISSNLKSSIRLKGQGRAINSFYIHGREETLLDFVDDFKQSHFVEFIRSEPTKNIHHYQAPLGSQLVDIVSVPFLDSNHRFIALAPIATAAPLSLIANTTLDTANSNDELLNSTVGAQPEPSDASQLSKLMATFAASPKKMLRNFWNIVAPDIITKNTIKTVQITRLKNFTLEDHVIETSIPPLVQLSMPMINIEADSSISAALNHIGIVNSFDPSQANFIGINGHPFNYNYLHLSNVLPKTSFKLDERGINYDKTIKTLESLRVYPKRNLDKNVSVPKKNIKSSQDDESIRWEIIDDVKLNRPFLYFICDTKTRLILYTGVVRNPAQDSK